MGEGNKRNKKCWCGSGKKFKNCHSNREGQEQLPLWEAGNKFRTTFNKPTCLAPSVLKNKCTDTIIHAHTVPRSTSLSQISKNGHVYSFKVDLLSIEKNNGKIVPKLTGINQASTFKGFCSYHDNELFANIEKRVFSSTPEQCFLLGYRAFSRECYTKQALVDMHELNTTADRGKPLKRQEEIQLISSLLNIGAQAGTQDNKKRKILYDEILVSRNFSDSKAYVFEFESPPVVMSAGAWEPTEDCTGKPLQDLLDFEQFPGLITCSVIWGGDYGAIIFQWLRDSDEICQAYVNSLLSQNEKTINLWLLGLLFENMENNHISPEWWNSLSKQTQNYFAALTDPFDNRTAHVSMEESISVGDISKIWKVTKHYSVTLSAGRI